MRENVRRSTEQWTATNGVFCAFSKFLGSSTWWRSRQRHSGGLPGLGLIQGSNLYLLGISLILWIDSVESLLTIWGMFVLQKIFVDCSCESMLMLYALLEFWALLYVFSVVDMLLFCFTWGVKIIMKSSVCSAGPVRSASATSVRSGEEW